VEFGYPLKVDKKGSTATVSEEMHILQMIEQLLFTVPGERVNRPTFGTGINKLIFAPNSNELAATTQFLIQGQLQQWLGNLIKVESVQVTNPDSTLAITIQYRVRQTQQLQVASFTKVV